MQLYDEFNQLLTTFVAQLVAVAPEGSPLSAADVEALQAALGAGGEAMKKLPATWIAARLGHLVEDAVDEEKHDRALLERMLEACKMGEGEGGPVAEQIQKVFDTVVAVYDGSPEERDTIFQYLCSILPAAVGASMLEGSPDLQQMLEKMVGQAQ